MVINEMNVLLELRNVKKTYFSGLLFTKEILALKDITFTLQKGEILTLVGESGSGKSTVANIILRLIKPSAGIILLHKKDIEKYTKKEYYKKVQIIFQDPFGSYNLYHKVDRTLHLAFKLHKPYPPLEEREKVIREVLDKIGLRANELLGRYPHQLSGGQLQRMLLARVLIIKPEILIADEATSMIDASSRAEILNLLTRLAREEELGVIFITHDIGQAQYLSDRVIVMKNGCIIEQGDPMKVLVHPEEEYTKELISSVPIMEERWEFVKY